MCAVQAGGRAKVPAATPNIAFNTKELTTNTGAPIINNEFSLRAGNRGVQSFRLLHAFNAMAIVIYHKSVPWDAHHTKLLTMQDLACQSPRSPYRSCTA